MSTSGIEIKQANASAVAVSDDALTVELIDGRAIVVPLSWFPRLLHATPAERANWRMIGRGEGIHWPDFDEDINVTGLLAGRASSESSDSLRRWLASRPR